MTREEHIAALEKYRDGILSGGISVPYDDLMIALDASISALLGPQPDPKTGLVPCGCGGKAVVVPKDNGFYIVCDSCEVSTTQDSFFNGTGFSAQSLDYAREDWNTAMGWKGGAI